MRILLLVSVFLLFFNAVGTLIYSALGQSLTSTAGRYVLVMYGVMTIATLTFILYDRQIKSNFMLLISNVMAAAVVGFYYGGTALPIPVSQQPPWAILGAIGAGVLTAWLMLKSPKKLKVWGEIGLGMGRSVVIYGWAFLNGAIGCMMINVGQFWGVSLIMMSFMGLVMTVRSVRG